MSTFERGGDPGGGRNPNWQEVLHLELQPGNHDLHISVRKYSKISAHDEIARGSISLPAVEQQGSQGWDQRVALQPARAGKGSALGGEVLLKLQYTTVQEKAQDRAFNSEPMRPSASSSTSSQPASTSLPALPSHSSGGEQPLQLSSAGGSASLSKLMNKLQMPRKPRVSNDVVPLPVLPLDIGEVASNGEAPLGQSPRQFSLQKALDKVLKKVGAKEKDRPSATSDAGYATAEESETASRRSSLASLTEPSAVLHDVHGAAASDSAQDRHRIMPGWQQGDNASAVLPTHASTSTQTDSPNMEPSAFIHASSQPSAAPEAISAPCQSNQSLPHHTGSLQNEPIFEERASEVSSAYSSISRGVQSSSDDLQPVTAFPATSGHSARASSFPTPPSPFAVVQEECCLADAAQANHGTQLATAEASSPAEASSSDQSGVPSLGANLTTAAIEPVLRGGSEMDEPAPAPPRDGRGRLEHLDTAYRQRQGSGASVSTSGSAASDMNGHADAGISAAAAHVNGVMGGEGARREAGTAAAGPSSQAQPIYPAPTRGFVAVQPLGSPFADHSYMEDVKMSGRGALLGCDSSTSCLSNLLSSSSSRQLVCMADENFQAGLKSMPERIPPLPNAIPQENGGVSEDGEASAPEMDNVPHVGPLALQPRLSAAPEDEDIDHGDGQPPPAPPPAGRVMRKTLSRKSPFLPEVLQSLNDYNDIVFCEEYGKKVLLGEGSFGEVYKASYLDCDIAVKKLNRINDAKSEEAFRQECAILKACRHPHIVNFMGVCKDEVGRICLMTELMDTSLMSALLLPDDANKQYHYYNQGRYILMCVAKALIYLHKHEIVHLDVKSANVLLKKGDAKLADVGLSLMLSKSFANSCSGMGTFSWAATELLLGSHPVTTASDIFSFGVLLWEVCTLEQPHLRHMRDITPEEAPEAIRQLFFNCVREDPHSRPTAKQVLQVLQEN